MELVAAVPDDAEELVISSVPCCVFDLVSFSLSIAVKSDGGSVLPSILPRQLPTTMEPCRQLCTPTSFQPTSSRFVRLYTRTRTCTCAPGVLVVRDTLVCVAQPQYRGRSGHGVFRNAHATRNDSAKHNGGRERQGKRHDQHSQKIGGDRQRKTGETKMEKDGDESEKKFMKSLKMYMCYLYMIDSISRSKIVFLLRRLIHWHYSFHTIIHIHDMILFFRSFLLNIDILSALFLSASHTHTRTANNLFTKQTP